MSQTPLALPAELAKRIDAWRADDPDDTSRSALEALLEGGDLAALQACFAGPLKFGTAGLRAPLGPGESRMNRLVVARASAGLADYVARNVPDAKERGVCVGFDGRRQSRELAEETACILAGAGYRVFRFHDVGPTPLLAFAVLDRRAAAGVMVTASHNPPEYNGYKVYWENGAQIIPPHDAGIAEAIAAVGPYAKIPRARLDDPRITRLEGDVERRYLDGVASLVLHPGEGRDLCVAYTALHGVGNRLAQKALAEAGFRAVESVAEQAEPDGAFPTVTFPNPEEKGAMDLVLALATRTRADLVIANDPDADRLALAVRDREGDYTQLSGNEVGALLGHYVLSEGAQSAHRLAVCSIVSSPMLGAIAAAHGARFEQTLTGFKWIANRAMELEAKEGLRFAFGYEEALGYTVGTLVRDKDGIGAAVVAADMAAWCKARGRTLLDELGEAYRRYGLYLSRQVSVTLPGLEGAARIARIVDAVRSAPPAEIGGLALSAVSDLIAATRTPRGGPSEKLDLPPSDAVALELEGGTRIMLRPSGTEPKIKYYFDARIDIATGEALEAARSRGNALLDELVRHFAAITDAVR